MTRQVFKFTALTLMLFLCVSKLSVAQEIFATLVGTVTDTSGAVIPNAMVTVHNNESGIDVRAVTTDGSGNFTVTNLAAGNYTVIVKSPGFSAYTANNVILNVAQKRPLEVQLQPGQVTENITISETANPVQTTSAAQVGTVTGTQIRELQLNNRNFEQLVTLQPGVVSGLPDVVNFGISNTSTVVVNGARASANNWTVDGADVNDSGSNTTLLNVPSVDAIQEFTLQRSTYDAQYGRSGGGQVVVATKSGTNVYHGDLYEFVRNDALNANDFFANSVGSPRAPERYNNYGFTLGGPLYIPRLYKRSDSKTFFFWSEEWRKTSQPSTDVATVPTAQELTGSFPGIQLNSAGAPAGCISNSAAGGQINPSCFSQNAKAYLGSVYSKFPANADNGNQYITNVVSLNNYRQDLVRLDQNVGNKIHLFSRFIQDVVPTTEPGGLFAGEPLPGISSTATNAPGRNVVINGTWTISPTVVNEAAFNYSWGAINSNITGTINSPAFVGALAGGLPYNDPYGRVPAISISGLTGVAVPVAPYFERNIDKNFFDNFSKVWGKHTIRAGVSIQFLTKTENAVNPTNGTFSFLGTNANPAFANFLLGNASSFDQYNRDIIPHLNYFNFEGYVQDDWKLTSRITLNLGLRYSFFPTPSDSNNVLNNFDPALYNPAAAPAINPTTGLFVAGQQVVPATYTNGIIFPVGSSCNAAQAIAHVTCSPFGSLVNPNSNNNWGPRLGIAWDPFGKGKTAIRAGYGIYYDRTLNGIWEQNAFSDPPLVQQAQVTNTSFDHPTVGTAAVPLGPGNITATGSPTFKVPSYQDWNFSIQQEILPNTTLEVAYVGTKGTHLLGEIDENQPTLGVRQASPTANVDAIRPFLGYHAFFDRTPDFDSNYNALQLALNRRVSQGLTLGVAYTWSKNLTNNTSDRGAPVYNTYNFAQNYGPASLNTPQIFIVNYVYQLPFFKDQRGLLGHAFGGWEVSGITTAETGQSLSLSQFNDPFRSEDFAGTPGTYPGGIGIDFSNIAPRPDVVPGVSRTGAGTVAQFFNTKAFTDAIGHFGTSGPGVLLGPGTFNWDISAIRNIKVNERFSFQFRAEFFNAFNHVNFNAVDTNVDSATYGRLIGDHLPRNIQLGLKLYF